MASLNKFDASEYPEQSQQNNYSPLKKGKYLACIIASETKRTKKGDGEMLSLRFEILEDGKYKGRNLFENLMLEHPSEKAVEVGKGKLASICRATGVMKPNDSEDLHDKPIIIDVGVRNNNQTGVEENCIWGYEKNTPKSAMKRTPLHSSLPNEDEINDDEIPF